MTYKIALGPWTEEDSASATMFGNLYTAFIGSTDSPNRAKSLEETRSALKVLDAFDSVSDVLDAGGQYRVLKKEGGDILLAEADWKLLQRSVDAFVSEVPFGLVRPAMRMKELVDKAEAVTG